VANQSIDATRLMVLQTGKIKTLLSGAASVQFGLILHDLGPGKKCLRSGVPRPGFRVMGASIPPPLSRWAKAWYWASSPATAGSPGWHIGELNNGWSTWVLMSLCDPLCFWALFAASMAPARQGAWELIDQLGFPYFENGNIFDRQTCRHFHAPSVSGTMNLQI
jgi:hypothetical protein